MNDEEAARRAHRRIAARDPSNCEQPDPANTVTDRLNSLLRNGGDGYVLKLCPNARYLIQAPILFAHNNQEISTVGYPTDDSRATLVVSGPVNNGQGHTTAVDGTCATCTGIKLRNIQIDGTRNGAPSTKGGGNIEFGNANTNQLIEYVKSYDPRGWTCLHIAEGPLTCQTITVQNNDIGPCGSEVFQEWADGISISCKDSVVRNNMIQGATDGGIVIFGSPGTQVYNNTIWVLNQTLLGGINMVDYDPWSGDYSGVVVRDNFILGGFATDDDNATMSKGTNVENAIIKIGIAIGPRTWFGDKFGSNVNRNGVVQNNVFSGALSYGIAATSARNFTVSGNVMKGNTSFIGARGSLCKDSDVVPTPAPFIVDPATTTSMVLQSEFQQIQDGDSLTCVLPPNGGDFWPYGLNPSNASAPFPNDPSGPRATGTASAAGSSTNIGGVVAGVIVGIVVAAVVAYFVRRWHLSHKEKRLLFNSTRKADYTHRLSQ